MDIGHPIHKKITIIDGRRDTKDWIEQYGDNDINKKVYPKYRPEDKVDY